MCDLFGNSAADAAQQQIAMMEAQQKKHDAAVAAGKKSIDDAFAQFTPDYFNKFKQSYLDAYNPQVRDQYGIAKDQLTSALADRDILESTPGANAFAQLDKTLANTEADIGNKSIDAENSLKANVNNTKTNLYGLNAAAADPLTMASQAQATAGTLVAPNSLPSLGNVFAGALSPFATGVQTNQQSMNPTGLPMFTQAPSSASLVTG